MASTRPAQRAEPPLARAVTAVVEAMFADESGPPPPDQVRFVAEDIQEFLFYSGLRLRWLYGACLFAVVWLAPLLSGSAPLIFLPWQQRVRQLARAESSLFALPFLLVKTVICIIYFEHPDAEADLLGENAGCLVQDD